MQMKELADIMKRCGVVGAGGAGFPSYAKLSDKADTIILNCAECEPLFRLHRQLLSDFTDEILEALNIVRDAVGAKDIIIAIKPSYTRAIEEVEERLNQFKNMKVAKLPEVYPAGDELIVIYETTGRVVKPGKLPISEGVIVFNVETMLNTYYAITENKPVTHKYITVAGEVKTPCTLKVSIGTPFEKLVEATGGETSDDCAWLSGGAMTGRLASRKETVTKTTNAILVLPKNHLVVMKKKTNTKINIYRGMSTCCQCRMCTDMCSRNLLGHPIQPHAFMRAATKGMTKDTVAVLNSMYCSQCKLCEMYACQQGLSPGSLIGVAKDELRKNGIKPDAEPKFTGVEEVRKHRLVPMERLIARLDIAKYDVEAPFVEKEISSKELKISLRQHIGQEAVPVCKAKESVKKGQKIAECKELGADIHSPINGTIKAVRDGFVIIKTQE